MTGCLCACVRACMRACVRVRACLRACFVCDAHLYMSLCHVTNIYHMHTVTLAMQSNSRPEP